MLTSKVSQINARSTQPLEETVCKYLATQVIGCKNVSGIKE